MLGFPLPSGISQVLLSTQTQSLTKLFMLVQSVF